ncbi:MAG: CAAX prenyl protease-related protein [Verrucomicrobiota bacterium]|jgi:CAAX prenyl protease-like protein
MPLRSLFSRSPLTPRVAPFVIFLLLTTGQGCFGPASAYWFYLAKTVVGLWLIFEVWPLVPEMRWALSWEAVAVGLGVFLMWVALDPWYPKLNWSKAAVENANPSLVFGRHSPLACFFLCVHVFGMTVVVPPLEEVFYRSFLYRFIARPNFLEVPLHRFLPMPFFVTAVLFGFEHSQWLAGILCGMAYQWLVLRKNRLGDAITAHAITNFLLGVWVVWRGAWNFW